MANITYKKIIVGPNDFVFNALSIDMPLDIFRNNVDVAPKYGVGGGAPKMGPNKISYTGY